MTDGEQSLKLQLLAARGTTEQPWARIRHQPSPLCQLVTLMPHCHTEIPGGAQPRPRDCKRLSL